MKKVWGVTMCACLAIAAAAHEGRAAQPVQSVRVKAMDEYPISGLGWKVTTEVKAKKPYTIAMVLKNNVNPWMNANAAGFLAAGKAMGFNAMVLSPAKNDNVEEQSRIVDDLIQRKVDAILLVPVDSNGIVPCVERAYAAKIPVIVEGTAANTDKVFGLYGTHYYEQGMYIARWVAEALGGKGNVINLPGPPEAQNAIERNAAIHDVLKGYPNIKIIAEQPSNFRRVDGMQVMENLIQKFGEDEIDAIIGSNDEAAMGAIMALEGAGYKAGLQHGGILVAGFDCNEDASHAIQDGRLDVSVNPDPPSLGWLGAAYLVQNLNDGLTLPRVYISYPDLNKMEGVIVDKTNIDYYIANIAWWKIPEAAK